MTRSLPGRWIWFRTSSPSSSSPRFSSTIVEIGSKTCLSAGRCPPLPQYATVSGVPSQKACSVRNTPSNRRNWGLPCVRASSCRRCGNRPACPLPSATGSGTECRDRSIRAKNPPARPSLTDTGRAGGPTGWPRRCPSTCRWRAHVPLRPKASVRFRKCVRFRRCAPA